VNEISRIAVLLTCHNRVLLTLRCLNSLYASNPSVEFLLTVYLTDDGSTDETSRLVEVNFPSVTIIQGDGSLYWNRGMYSAWCRARNTEHDFYLLLNDDVELESDAILALLDLYRKSVRNCVIVGKTVDPISRQTTYGALKRKNFISRNTFIPISAKSDIAVTFNANCVLIPARAIEFVGILDPFYTQQFGDIDLGLRLHSKGWEILELAKPVASLAKNSASLIRISVFRLKDSRIYSWIQREFLLENCGTFYLSSTVFWLFSISFFDIFEFLFLVLEIHFLNRLNCLINFSYMI